MTSGLNTSPTFIRALGKWFWMHWKGRFWYYDEPEEGNLSAERLVAAD